MCSVLPLWVGEVKGRLQVRGEEARRKGGDTVCREREEGQRFVKQACRPGHLHSAP